MDNSRAKAVLGIEVRLELGLGSGLSSVVLSSVACGFLVVVLSCGCLVVVLSCLGLSCLVSS
jgi:hypothetical protein